MNLDQWKAERIAELDRFVADARIIDTVARRIGVEAALGSADDWDARLVRWIEEVDAYRAAEAS